MPRRNRKKRKPSATFRKTTAQPSAD